MLRHKQYWPLHAFDCDRSVHRHTYLEYDDSGTGSVYPHPAAISIGTRSAVEPAIEFTGMQLPVPVLPGVRYDFVVNALYAKHDAGMYVQTCNVRPARLTGSYLLPQVVVGLLMSTCRKIPSLAR